MDTIKFIITDLDGNTVSDTVDLTATDAWYEIELSLSTLVEEGMIYLEVQGLGYGVVHEFVIIEPLIADTMKPIEMNTDITFDNLALETIAKYTGYRFTTATKIQLHFYGKSL